MEYTIKKLSALAGVSTRTLRYYDEINLLKPCRINSSGYRIYGQQEVNMLQQILFYKELGLELSHIADILSSPTFERISALKEHLAALHQKQLQMRLLIQTVEKTILMEEGKMTMTDQEKFQGFKENLMKENEEKYGEEIRKKYGEETVAESNAKMMSLTVEEYQKMEELSLEMMHQLEHAVKNKVAPSSEAGLAIAMLHKKWLSFTWSQYSKEAHRGLGQMYVDDERFTAYYDKNINGCARFLCDAIYALTA